MFSRRDKSKQRSTNRSKFLRGLNQRTLSIENLEDRRVMAAFEFVDPHPSASNGFGSAIVALRDRRAHV